MATKFEPKLHRAKPVPVTTIAALDEVVAAYKEFEEFVFDVETKGPHRGDPRRNDLFWISLAGPGRADVIPCGHPLGDITGWAPALTKTGKISQAKTAKPTAIYGPVPRQLWPADVLTALEPLLFSDARKIGHGLKFDLETVAKYYEGRVPPPPYGDTMIACFLANENHVGNRPYGLGNCVGRAFDYHYDKSIGKDLDTYPFSDAARYSYLDAKMDWLLWNKVMPIIEAEGLMHIFDLEMNLLRVVVDMEQHGVTIDEKALARLDADFQTDLDETYGRVRDAYGDEINLNASAQVIDLVYNKRNHKVRAWTEKTQQPSTARNALKGYAETDPVVADYLHWAEVHKLHSTFIESISDRLVEGKLHADFDQRGARTGRFSCRNPNLQNIPIRQSKLVRDLFVAPPGYKLVVADYSQVELRILAHFTGDPLLLEAYNGNLDLHTLTAQRAYNVTEPTTRQRSLAKNVNFSMAYRVSAKTLVERYEVPNEREAQKLIDTFYSTYKRVKPWADKLISDCRKTSITILKARHLKCDPAPPYVKTILGRKRRLPEILWNSQYERHQAERQAINVVIQGSAADIMKYAMVELHRLFQDKDMHIVFTVHDELGSVVREDLVDDAVALVKQAMEEVPVKLKVPLVADVKVGDAWSVKA